MKASVWAKVALKLVGLALGMLALSGVGLVSILSGAGGVQVPLSSLLESDIHAAWLANKPAASPHAIGAANAVAPGSASSIGAALAASTSGAVAPSAVGTRTGTSTDTGTGASTSAGTATAGMTQDGKVILNLASNEDLRHLPGVGQKRADAILALRARLGRFKQVSDLLRVKGIGVRGLKKILPHVLLDAPKPAA